MCVGVGFFFGVERSVCDLERDRLIQTIRAQFTLHE